MVKDFFKWLYLGGGVNPFTIVGAVAMGFLIVSALIPMLVILAIWPPALPIFGALGLLFAYYFGYRKQLKEADRDDPS